LRDLGPCKRTQVGWRFGSEMTAFLKPLQTIAAQDLWGKAQKLGLAFVTCLALLWGVSLMVRAVRRAVAAGQDGVTSDAERRAKTLGAVLTNAARVLAVAFFLVMMLQEFGSTSSRSWLGPAWRAWPWVLARRAW
jgi:hypothetical protein